MTAEKFKAIDKVERGSEPSERAVAFARQPVAAGFPASLGASVVPQQVGNQAVQRLFSNGAIRAQLQTSSAGDAAEEEADQLARQVENSAPTIHRKAESGSPGQQETGSIGLGTGRPLSAGERGFFEPRLATDLSDVRIHTDGAAERSAESINARAFTLGTDIAFGQGEYSPQSSEGRTLLAHELAHIVLGHGGIRRNPPPSFTLTEIVTSDHANFTVPASATATSQRQLSDLQPFYSNYVSGGGTATAWEWALSQTTGRPRVLLERLCGPEYARGQAVVSPPVSFATRRLPDSLDPTRLASAGQLLGANPNALFARLRGLPTTDLSSGTISRGWYNILKGNVGEILSAPLQQQVLADMLTRYPGAQLFHGATARLRAGAVWGNPVLFTDGIVATISDRGLELHATIEAKSGEEGGASATEQHHRWLEGHSTEGFIIQLPGVARAFFLTDDRRSVYGISTARRIIIAPQGSEQGGSGSVYQNTLIAPVTRLAMPYNAAEIDAITARVLQLLQWRQQVTLRLAQLEASVRSALPVSSVAEVATQAQSSAALGPPYNGLVLAEGRLFQLTESADGGIQVRQVDTSPGNLQLPTLPSGAADPLTQALPLPPVGAPTGGASAIPGPGGAIQSGAPLGLPGASAVPALTAGGVQGTAPTPPPGPYVIPALPGSWVTAHPPLINPTGRNVVAGGQVYPPSPFSNIVGASPVGQGVNVTMQGPLTVQVGELVVVGGRPSVQVTDARTGQPIAIVMSGGVLCQVVGGDGRALVQSGTTVRPASGAAATTTFRLEPVPLDATPRAPGGYSTGTRMVAGGVGIIVVANEILGGINRVRNVQQQNIDRGWGQIRFWTQFGGNPRWDIWDRVGQRTLGWRTEPQTAPVMGDATFPVVTELDLDGLSTNLPTLIGDYASLTHFLLAGGMLQTVISNNDPSGAQDGFPPIRYRAIVGGWNPTARREYDLTPIIRPIFARVTAQLDQRQAAEFRALTGPPDVFRLRSGSNTTLRRAAHGQALMSAEALPLLGPDPWVRLAGERVGGGAWSWFRRGHSGARVRVMPVNGDAARAGLVSAYVITQSIGDTLDEVEGAGREILSRVPESGSLQSFVAGPDPNQSGPCGVTRYYVHPNPDVRWTAALGELRWFWVDESELEPLTANRVQEWANPILGDFGLPTAPDAQRDIEPTGIG